MVSSSLNAILTLFKTTSPFPLKPLLKPLYVTVYAVSRDYVGTPKSPQKTPHISIHPTEKQAPTLSLRVLCGLLITSFATRTELATRGSESVFRMCGSMWGLLRGPYVIPRPGVPLYMSCCYRVSENLYFVKLMSSNVYQQ